MKVRARLTKGDAFRLQGAAYKLRQEAVTAELAALSREEIFEKHPYATYDLRK